MRDVEAEAELRIARDALPGSFEFVFVEKWKDSCEQAGCEGTWKRVMLEQCMRFRGNYNDDVCVPGSPFD